MNDLNLKKQNKSDPNFLENTKTFLFEDLM
jgi:hypothetical protein